MSSSQSVVAAAPDATNGANSASSSAGAPVILRSSSPRSDEDPASRRSTAAKTPIPSALTIQIHHHFAKGKLSVWVDDHLTLSADLRGEAHKHLLVFNGVKGYESAVLPVPPGMHRLRVRVTSGGYDQSALLATSFSSHREQILQITCATAPPKLHAILE